MNNIKKNGCNSKGGFERVENCIKISFIIALIIMLIAGTMIDSESEIPRIITACATTWMFGSIVYYLSIIAVINDRIDDIVDEYLDEEEHWADDIKE